MLSALKKGEWVDPMLPCRPAIIDGVYHKLQKNNNMKTYPNLESMIVWKLEVIGLPNVVGMS